ncbi:type VI secretion system-associated FHA domain protein TagH [Paracraurococcus lichenis]|uniref:Type VI secretion system-associated FHA domain protein TagH n=1 Tax=Paracraurococcus lichenis TaxID=3064888 RepID=A0ABT9DXW9_9PROT|nr:type VI secretion system-associated FHA domain protein TagH [Paracraurococcus sp. LOR1-02]MDO9708755.1 type VI secretion system-associated FHA domain protein TagH [Paracraurococcus sp. LOR1-02]
MRLTLSTIRCPPGQRPDQWEATGGEVTLGRGPDNDWVLPDPTRHVSKRHCVLSWHPEGWRLTDTSANGTFLNEEPTPIGQGRSRDLRDGDRIRLGPFEVEVRLQRPAEEETLGGVPVGDAEETPGGDAIPDRWWEGDRPASLTQRPPPPVTQWPMAVPPIGSPAPAEAPPPASVPAPPGDALAALLAAAGMPDLRPADQAAAARSLGRAFRALVAGLRQVLIARAEIKGLFRIEQTTIRARGNNPLKFAANDEDALAALLGAGRRADMDAAEAVADALRDIRLHEFATMEAMQAALRSLLDSLSPARIEAAAGPGGRALLPWQREARLWEAYAALHAETLQALSDDFDSAFGKAFARAYEQALHEADRRE